MKHLTLILFSALLILAACNTKHTASDQPVSSYELNPKGDTINMVDENGFKQGIWIDRESKDTMVYLNDTGHFTTTRPAKEILRLLKKDGNKIVTVKPDSLTGVKK